MYWYKKVQNLLAISTLRHICACTKKERKKERKNILTDYKWNTKFKYLPHDFTSKGTNLPNSPRTKRSKKLKTKKDL